MLYEPDGKHLYAIILGGTFAGFLAFLRATSLLSPNLPGATIPEAWPFASPLPALALAVIPLPSP